MREGAFPISCRGPISASQTFFLFTPEAINNIDIIKEYEKKDYFFLSFLKETLGLLNHRRNKYIKQRSHHSIFELFRKKKEGW